MLKNLKQLWPLFVFLLFAALANAEEPAKPTPRTRLLDKVLTNPLGNLCERYIAPKTTQYLSATDAWVFSDEATKRLAALSDQMAQGDANQEAIAAEIAVTLAAERARQLNPISRFFHWGAQRTMFNHPSLYNATLGGLFLKIMGPHYNPVFNRVATPDAARWSGDANDLSEIVVALHELQHAYDRNRNPIPFALLLKFMPWDYFSLILQTPVSGMVRFWTESKALGAQWEFAKRLPQQFRDKAIRTLRAREYFYMCPRNALRNLLGSARLHASFKEEEMEITFADDVMGHFTNLVYQLEELYQSYDFKDRLTLSNEDITHFIRNRKMRTTAFLPHLERLNLILDIEEYAENQGRSVAPEMRGMLLKITRETLQNASLPTKEAFLRAQEKIHGYTSHGILAHQFGPNGFKRFAFVTSAIQIALWLSGGGTSPFPSVMLMDLDWLIKLFI